MISSARWSLTALVLLGAAGFVRGGDAPKPATRNVILITADGLRWQEVFRGADDALMNKTAGGVADVEALRSEFARDTPQKRREALMPFLWSTIAAHGQIYGNADAGSTARVTNGKNFSYPGYNEIFTGAPDPRVDSNAKRPNPNVTVFEWLNAKPEFHGKVAAVGCWDVFPYILNTERSGLPINSGWVPIEGETLNEREILLNRIMAQAPRIWPDCRDDAISFPIAVEHFRRHEPRVFYIGMGDTDEQAHAGRYDQYLHAARAFDANLKQLWDEIQANPKYRGNTTIIVTTDHGRGDPPLGWRSHNAGVKGSDSIWIAVLGPDTPALGMRTNVAPVTQSQIAATLAALLGEDYNAAFPRAGKPIADAIKPGANRAQAAAEPLRRIAFGSCATQERPQPIWNAVLAFKPELLLLLGDNIYADTEDMAVMRAKYAKLAAMPGFKRLRESTPILATWDDHDLGENDAGGAYPKKDESQKEFLDFFGVAADSPRRSQKGVYDARVFGPEGKRVQVIMLDTRYFRGEPVRNSLGVVNGKGPYLPNTDPKATVLGEAQWAWLEAQLRVPAEVRLLVSSIQLVAEDHGWEKWMNFPLERDRLYKLLRDTKAQGVVVLSGDRHLAELSMMDAGLGYPLYDLTASGWNQASRSWRPLEVNGHRVATMNHGDNFGTLLIDWDRRDPTISLEIRDVEGAITIRQVVKLSTLKRAAD